MSFTNILDPLKSIKYMLIVINTVFLLTGILLVLSGVIVLGIYLQYDTLITNTFITIPSFVIATSAIIILVSVLGFYASYSKQFYLIVAYACLMLVVLVFEISMVIVTYRLSGNVLSEIRPVMLESLGNYGSMREVAQLWDELQSDFSCCGANNRFDWPSDRIPITCCYIDYGTVSPFQCTTSNSYTTGCSEVLGNWLSYNAFVVAVTSVVALCFQVLITLMAGWLAWRAKSEEVELEY